MRKRLHTADHILFSVLEKKFPVKTRALQFADDSCRAVYECETDLRDLKPELEQEVNEVIDQGMEVTSYNLPRNEAEQITDVSLVPESVREIGIYEIVGLNKLACAGPHVGNTNEVGRFEILDIKKKGENCYSIKYTVK